MDSMISPLVSSQDDGRDESSNPLVAPDDNRNSVYTKESRHSSLELQKINVPQLQSVPDMWSKEYIGLYSQYAAVGLLYGTTGALLPFCVYNFDGPSNVCANARNITTFAWNLKIFFAILTDTYRPFGMRRKPWMLAGWCMVLVLLLILTFTADSLSLTAWLMLLMLVQAFAMLSDVPADGYSVEIGKLETKENRGQVLATGQRIRFSFCVVAGFIQTFFLNGPTTNAPDCPTDFNDCWSFGLTINGYYGLLFGIIFILTVPIFWLKELDATNIPRHTASHFFHEIWLTLQNLTTFYLIVYVIGVSGLTNFTNNANITLQYYVIKLTNFQAGIDTITTYSSLVLAIWLFQRYMMNTNWRYTQYLSVLVAAALGLVWIAPFYNEGGTMNAWFTIFIDLDTYFAQGLSQVLFSLAVIELSKPGQEATTYELIITVANSALLVNGIISTQLLTPFKSGTCDDDNGNCSSDTVDTSSVDAFNESNGPARFTQYTLTLNAISVVSVLIFARFLPRSKEECHEWKAEGERLGTSERRGMITLIISIVVILYGVVAAALLLDVSTSCLPEVGGSGC